MIQDRVKFLIKKYSNGVKSAFASRVGLSPSVIENMVGIRGGNPRFDVLVKILTSFPELDANWLVLGERRNLNDEVAIGNELREYFAELSITEQQAADSLGVDLTVVREHLNGKPFDEESAEIWSETFGIQEKWLFSGKGNMFKKIQGPININLESLKYVAESRTGYQAEEIRKLRSQLAELDERIENLSAQNKTLHSDNAAIQEKCEIMLEKINKLLSR